MKFALVLMSVIMAGVFANAQGEAAGSQQNPGAAVSEQKVEAVKEKKEKKHKKHSKKKKEQKEQKEQAEGVTK